jgi:phage gp37-like protein
MQEAPSKARRHNAPSMLRTERRRTGITFRQQKRRGNEQLRAVSRWPAQSVFTRMVNNRASRNLRNRLMCDVTAHEVMTACAAIGKQLRRDRECATSNY